MKTSAFYQEIQQKLVESGVVVFNINGRTARADIEVIRKSFGSTYVFRATATGNVVVVATRRSESREDHDLRAVGHRVDERIASHFSIAELVDELRR